MQRMFNDMVNVSDGGYYKGVGRGVVAGPSVTIRHPSYDIHLLDFRPPSISAGCGGIDMFLGSFSFINEEQFTQLLQAIAANAAGYVFKLALDTMCPTCGEVVDGLQKTVRAMNALAGDTCRVAQKMVDYAAKEMDLNSFKQQMAQGPLATAAKEVGAKLDDFASFLSDDESNNCALTDSQVKAILGNIVWKILKKDNLVGIMFSDGDTDFAEELMNITGTVIGTRTRPDSSDCEYPDVKYISPTLTIADVVYGVKEEEHRIINGCVDTNDCTELTPQEHHFKGLKQIVEDVLVPGEDNSTSSFIYRLSHNSGSLTSDEKKLIMIAPEPFLRLRDMAVCKGPGNYDAMLSYAKLLAEILPIEIVTDFLGKVTSAIDFNALARTEDIGGGHYHDQPAGKMLSAELKDLHKAIQKFRGQNRIQIIQAMEQIYSAAMQNCIHKPVTKVSQK
jgi:conjugative transfer pilus assembly protein TraH